MPFFITQSKLTLGHFKPPAKWLLGKLVRDRVTGAWHNTVRTPTTVITPNFRLKLHSFVNLFNVRQRSRDSRPKTNNMASYFRHERVLIIGNYETCCNFPQVSFESDFPPPPHHHPPTDVATLLTPCQWLTLVGQCVRSKAVSDDNNSSHDISFLVAVVSHHHTHLVLDHARSPSTFSISYQ